MTFTKRQLPGRLAARRAGLVLGMALLLGFAGPFGTYPALRTPVRYAFWIGMVFAGYAAALAADKLVPAAPRLGQAMRLVAVATASALPATFLTAWVLTFVQPGRVIEPRHLPALFVAVAAVQVAIVFTLLRELKSPSQPLPARIREKSGSFPQALLSRLPKRLGEEIIALEAEDHYLRVHTTLGSELVLMRLSDAVASIEPDLGLQVHRSWWVAHAAICEVNRADQRLQLRLANGLAVPVGRTYSAAVRNIRSRS